MRVVIVVRPRRVDPRYTKAIVPLRSNAKPIQSGGGRRRSNLRRHITAIQRNSQVSISESFDACRTIDRKRAAFSQVSLEAIVRTVRSDIGTACTRIHATGNDMTRNFNSPATISIANRVDARIASPDTIRVIVRTTDQDVVTHTTFK